MERDYKFTIGLAVQTRDVETGQIIKGVVIDKTRDTVFIKWDDLTDPVEHRQDEYYLIKLVRN